MARELVDVGSPNYFDLENPVDLARLSEPMTALAGLTGLVVIDEVQLRPDLFPVLRVLADRAEQPAAFLVLGSAQPAALRQASESLSGRVRVIELGGFTSADVGTVEFDKLWLRGGFPRAYLANSDTDASEWLSAYTRSLVERDLFALDVRLPSTALRRFVAMVSHYHGQTWNSAEPARSLGISEHTVRRYLDLLGDALLVRQLQPWFENLGKRQVRSPKIYIRDTGLTHHLLGVDTMTALLRHPKSGATWEGLVVEELLRAIKPPEAYFWGTHGGAELDLFLPSGEQRIGIEIKRADAPTITASMRSALTHLQLDRLVILYPGTRSYELSDRVTVEPVTRLADQAATRLMLYG
jgi:predicted AAA+ superfamily ATPase